MYFTRCGCCLSCASFRGDERQLSLFPNFPRCHAHCSACERCSRRNVAIALYCVGCCHATELTCSA